ncbi:hypothetical protein [Clostridium sp. C2-6-12]|uniref:hypothetical protein n=1 Tax=Clostridium sp. C2-6-12 TaxID=2698832 RepID=UPI00136B806D|nr:hypothetical protein [Clostridium sp. C2-6-12]
MEVLNYKLLKYMDAWAKADRFSGTVLVSKKEDIVLQSSYGYANVQYKILNKINTKYKIASYTKQFTDINNGGEPSSSYKLSRFSSLF